MLLVCRKGHSRKSMCVKINMVVLYTDNLDCYHYFTVNEIENVFIKANETLIGYIPLRAM